MIKFNKNKPKKNVGSLRFSACDSFFIGTNLKQTPQKYNLKLIQLRENSIFCAVLRWLQTDFGFCEIKLLYTIC